MSIHKVNNCQFLSSHLNKNFKAKTTITAPKEALSKEDRIFLKEMGSKIGTDQDEIDITVGEKQAEDYRNVVFYNIRMNSILDGWKQKMSIDLPISCDGKIYQRYRPEVYIPKMLERLDFDYKHRPSKD